jgi:hypothetical protein
MKVKNNKQNYKKHNEFNSDFFSRFGRDGIGGSSAALSGCPKVQGGRRSTHR